jgi:hypothetical protein
MLANLGTREVSRSSCTGTEVRYAKLPRSKSSDLLRYQIGERE